MNALVIDTPLRYDAVAIGQVTSTIPGAPAPSGFTVGCGRSDVTVTVIDAGFCLAADVPVAFPGPEPVQITVAAPGYASIDATVTIDPAALPLELGAYALAPASVRLQGRVVALENGAPLPGARVVAVDDPTVGVPPPEHTLALGRPLARAHPAAAIVEQVSVTATGPTTALAAAAHVGAATITLHDRTGLSAGSVLGLAPTPAGDFSEYAKVLGPGPAPLGTAGPVTLRDPLTLSLPADNPASALTLATAASTALADATPADTAIVTTPDALAGLIRIEPGTDEEYRAVGATASQGGYWRLDGVAGVASLWLSAEAAGRPPGYRLVSVPYPLPVTVVDFKLSP